LPNSSHHLAAVLIEKAKILQILRQRGQDTRAEWVDRELPAEVDTDDHAGLLATLRLTPTDLAQLSQGGTGNDESA
jgi:hypothetical protein